MGRRAINFCLVSLIFWGGTLLHAAEPDVSIEIVDTESVAITKPSAAHAIKSAVEAFHERIEGASSDDKTSWIRRRVANLVQKFNLLHPMRVAKREMQSQTGDVGGVPGWMLVLNAAVPMVGIHLAESTVIGPGFIYLGSHLEGLSRVALTAWGGLLINPFPTGTFVDIATETFCIPVLFIVARPSYQRGMAWLELRSLRVAGRLARLVRADILWNAIFESKTGLGRLQEALNSSKASTVEISMEELKFVVKDKGNEPLAELHLELMEGEKLRLADFIVHPKARTWSGGWQLQSQLWAFGANIRDAVLKPNQLVAGGHGVVQVPGREWKTNGTAVLLGSKKSCGPRSRDGAETWSAASSDDKTIDI